MNELDRALDSAQSQSLRLWAKISQSLVILALPFAWRARTRRDAERAEADGDLRSVALVAEALLGHGSGQTLIEEVEGLIEAALARGEVAP